ncbi:adenosylcobinamide-phosphate synthase CbiB [Lampropedia puyangensis]|nr:adenosylcobinamide-phosphate synthase CbiB [Lampropedia puyangensis]
MLEWFAPQALPWPLQMVLAMVAAMALDAYFGEPPLRWHPVVWMGRSLQWAEAWVFARANSEDNALANTLRLGGAPATFWRGALVWCAIALLCVGLGWGVQCIAKQLPWPFAVALLALAFKPMLAWRMLRQEVQGVQTALEHSLPQGQQQLARLVSRDTKVLDATQVRESALESLSENLNDSVLAPLFWFAVLGLPGAVLYRFANTADAMWGYPGQRGTRHWFWAGKWAARADDVLSAIPARLTAVLLLLISAKLAHVCFSATSAVALAIPAWRTLCQEAARTPSPNSGWPMATMALLLHVRLGKPGVYVLNPAGRAAAAEDIPLAITLAQHAVLAGVVAMGLLALGVA